MREAVSSLRALMVMDWGHAAMPVPELTADLLTGRAAQAGTGIAQDNSLTPRLTSRQNDQLFWLKILS